MVRFLLSVSASIITETLGGIMASRVKASRAAPDADFPCPRARAASIDALGIPALHVPFLAPASSVASL